MSLKSFHIVFVAASVLLAVVGAIYAITNVGGAAGWGWAIGSLLGGALLVYYGRRFLEKMKDVENQ